jgi:3-hydroxyisobutyrate dehydrogenase-like beta-hydroxyacid dehydrogenase
MKVSVLGLGSMGVALANRLMETGHSVTVWNRSSGKAGDLVSRGARDASSLSDAVSGAEVVFTLLSDDAAVRAVTLDGNVVGMLPPGTVLVDMSTVSPDTSRAVGAAAPDDHFIDAPILGRPQAFAAGKATLLLGGARELVTSLDPLWNDLSATHYYTGPNGTATTLKLLSNLILVGGTQLLIEAVVTAQKLGFGNEVLSEVFGGSPAVAAGARVRLDDILGGDHVGWWTLLLANKDLTLALALAQQAGVHLPLGEASERFIVRSIEAGYGSLDLGAMAEVLRGKVPSSA